MEHGAAFIDSQNRANTFVNYAGVKNVVGPQGKKKKKNWRKRKYDVAQIASINRRGGNGRTVASTTARLVLRFGRRSFFGDIAENTSIGRVRGDMRAHRSIYVREIQRRGFAARRHARSTHVPGKPALIFHVCAITRDPFRAGRSSN